MKKATPRTTSAVARWPSKLRVTLLARTRSRLPDRYRAEHDGSAFAFGIRLLATVVVTFAVVGVTAYVFLERDQEQQHIADYAAAQRADARAFEAVGARASRPAEAINDIDVILDSIAKRPGILKASLIDPRRVIRAEIGWTNVGETVKAEPHIDAALKHGRSFAGRDTGGVNHRDFQFVVPVNLPAGRYAYEVTYDHRTYDAQVGAVRRIIALIGLLALISGGGVFYVVGGRRLMRDHRMVILRATRDGLTDLPNQRAFQEEFPRAVAPAARYEDPLALLLLDVDHFKLINDRHGHPCGDAVLKGVARVLREARPGDRPYRVGGDEFALSLAHTDAAGARTVAAVLSQSLAEADIEVSIGVSALRPGLKADTLRAEADAALYEAKRQGGDQAAHFDDIRERVFVTTSEKKEAVQRLIEEERLTTVFQPIWNFEAETLLGLEALSRPDPSYGLSGPAEAFDIAEQIGQVHALDVLCVKNALRSASELEPGVLLFLNLSPLTLDLDADADAWLAPAVERAGLRPQAVVVEVTERFGGRTAPLIKRLKQLRLEGFQIAVDDVGTGNSGLAMLCKVDAEFVKIDRSIVLAAPTESNARAVLMAMATFARQTGTFVIAEGIEDGDALEFLRGVAKNGLSPHAIIQGGQGFGLGRPSHDLSPQSPAILHDRRLALHGTQA
jgi:diguanylate cyclase (GGDEF)-like protein